MPSHRRGSRKGGWMQTFSGNRYYPLDPKPEDINVQDIAHALSHQCRFGGHCDKFYSVSQHSVLVSKLVEEMTGGNKQMALCGLLHDAGEAYLVDVPRPVKIQLEGYDEMEDNLLKVIAEKFKLDEIFNDVVKEADDKVLATEARDLMQVDHKTWKLPEPCEFEIKPVGPVASKTMFLKRFKELTIDE
jgi:5'-deoxynucleotidase YfbR-like HD superfamily hydrolase